MATHERDRENAGKSQGKEAGTAAGLEDLLAGAGAGAGPQMALETISALLLLNAVQRLERAAARQEEGEKIGEATTAQGVAQIYTLGTISAAMGAAAIVQSAYPQTYLSLRAAERAFG